MEGSASQRTSQRASQPVGCTHSTQVFTAMGYFMHRYPPFDARSSVGTGTLLGLSREDASMSRFEVYFIPRARHSITASPYCSVHREHFPTVVLQVDAVLGACRFTPKKATEFVMVLCFWSSYHTACTTSTSGCPLYQYLMRGIWLFGATTRIAPIEFAAIPNGVYFEVDRFRARLHPRCWITISDPIIWRENGVKRVKGSHPSTALSRSFPN
jgi:hypothetical protein